LASKCCARYDHTTSDHAAHDELNDDGCLLVEVAAEDLDEQDADEAGKSEAHDVWAAPGTGLGTKIVAQSSYFAFHNVHRISSAAHWFQT